MGVPILEELIAILREVRLSDSQSNDTYTATTASSTKDSDDSTNSSSPHEEKNVTDLLREAINIIKDVTRSLGGNDFDRLPLPREISIIPHSSKLPTISYADIVKRSLKTKKEPPTYADKVRVGIDR
jgi:hypothetical protein